MRRECEEGGGKRKVKAREGEEIRKREELGEKRKAEKEMFKYEILSFALTFTTDMIVM